MTHKQIGMRTVNRLIDFILGMPDDTTSVLLDSNKFKLEIPISEKDVMCTKVIRFIEEEYGDHTIGETIEMLQDTIWWTTTFLVAFKDKECASTGD